MTPPTRRSPPLAYVRAFEAAARHLSFTKAAQELGFTQAAISTQVRALEQLVGRPLFTRNARSLTLTESGESYLPTLRQALNQIDDATDAIAKSARAPSVVIACPTSLAQIWLPDVLARFRQSQPQTEVLVYATVWERAADEVADLTLSIHREDEVPPGCERLWPEHLMLVCAPQMAAQVQDGAAWLHLPQIVVAGRQEYLTLMAQALGVPSVGQVPVLRSNSSNVALEMAARGLGVTITVASLAQKYVARGLVVAPLDARPRSPWAYYLRLSGPRHGAAAQAMLAVVRAEAALMA